LEHENELVERCRKKDDGAWTKLIQKYRREIYRLCFRATGREEEAEDLTQEIFLKVFKAIEAFDSRRASFTTWLYRVARNHIVDYYRCTRKDRITSSIEDELPQIEQSQGRADHPPDHIELSERQAVLQKALNQLSPGLREAVVLRDLHGLEYTEVSRVLGIPSGTAKSRVHRGHLELGRVLGAPQGQLPQPASALSYG
jgi:RNA polymerase sigma factor (sigma-70 family)